MKTRPCAFLYLLLFVLLAGQWAYATHLHDDAVLDSSHHCQLCVHGIQFDSFLPAGNLTPPVLAPEQFSVTPIPATRSTRRSRFHDSRAPPHG